MMPTATATAKKCSVAASAQHLHCTVNGIPEASVFYINAHACFSGPSCFQLPFLDHSDQQWGAGIMLAFEFFPNVLDELPIRFFAVPVDVGIEPLSTTSVQNHCYPTGKFEFYEVAIENPLISNSKKV